MADTIDVNITIQALKSQCVLYYKFTDGNGQDTIIPCDVNDNPLDAEGTIHSDDRLLVHHIRTSLGEGHFMPGSQYKLTLWRIPPSADKSEPEVHITNCNHVSMKVDACNISNAELLVLPGSISTSSTAPGLPAVVSVSGPSGIKILYSSVMPTPPLPPRPRTNYFGIIVIALILIVILIYYNRANKEKKPVSSTL